MTIREIFYSMEYGQAPESASNAHQWLATMGGKLNHFIDGDFALPDSKQFFDTQHPASGEVLCQLADGNEADVDKAVAAATKAHKTWSELSGHQRAKYLYAIARQIQKHSRLFAVLESLDNGKPIRESRDIDIPLVARHFYHHAGWAQSMESEMPGYESVGVVGQVIPWNFPLLMLAWKVAPALAMGNTLVLKPAEFTSITAVLFAQICQNVGLPKGVFNLVLGDEKAGKAVVSHPDINKIAFTGSTEVGRHIRRAIAGSGKKLSLELGGKSAYMIFDDADIDSSVEGLVDAIWFNQGQVCCAGSRLLVQENIAEKVIDKVKARMSKIVVGDPLNKSVDMGAIVDPSQQSQIADKVSKGKEEGATVWQPTQELPSGCFFPPTLITDVEPASTLAQEEIFGPVLVVMTFRTPSEAIQIANNTRYGLAASIWTENVNLALDLAPKVKAGAVWINCTNMFDAAAGFGGYRESGFGREGGKEGLFEYVTADWQHKLSYKPVYKTGKTKLSKSDKIDATPKLYIGGKQTRPDSGYSFTSRDAHGNPIADLPDANRKDLRNAIEANNKATSWTSATAHNRAQVLFYIAENLDYRKQEFALRIQQLSGKSSSASMEEVEQAIERIYYYAGMTDKYDGAVHSTPGRHVTIAMHEAIGNMIIVAPEEAGFIGFISTLMPALAMGNRVTVITSTQYALLATDFYQILETSDVPAGAVNILCGDRQQLAEAAARHMDVDALWCWDSLAVSTIVERFAADNMKRTWVNYGMYHDWFEQDQGQGREFLRRAVEVKNIWVPYGE